MKKAEKVITFLGKDTAFQGKLKFEGTIRIDGQFKGEILSNGNLIVGEEGMIEADIHVSYIAISGECHGNITADQRVDIHAPGKVFGNIQAPVVVIDEGVIFEGNTRMYQAKNAAEKKQAIVESDEYSGGPLRTSRPYTASSPMKARGNPSRTRRSTAKAPFEARVRPTAQGTTSS